MEGLRIYFAPLEGVTDAVFRRVHRACFPGVDKYFIPFISPTQHLTMTSREQRAVSPAENAGVPAIPQVLTKNPDHFVHMAHLLGDAGFPEINLNLGCPSGTVTAKGKGAGMLRDVDGLRAFLDIVYTESPIPVSIKTRIGFESLEEWPALRDLFSEYPIHELIIHPRTRTEFYKGQPHRELCKTFDAFPFPWVHNGDLTTAAECRAFLGEYPGAAALMLGRGMVTNPALARELGGGAPLDLKELEAWHERLFTAYAEAWPASAVLGHMREIMDYVMCCFEEPKRVRKALRKARSLEDYRVATEALFRDFKFRERPKFNYPFE